MKEVAFLALPLLPDPLAFPLIPLLAKCGAFIESVTSTSKSVLICGPHARLLSPAIAVAVAHLSPLDPDSLLDTRERFLVCAVCVCSV